MNKAFQMGWQNNLDIFIKFYFFCLTSLFSSLSTTVENIKIKNKDSFRFIEAKRKKICFGWINLKKKHKNLIDL